MLFALKFLQGQLRFLAQTLQQTAVPFLFLVLYIDGHKAVEGNPGRRHSETVLSSVHLYRRGLIDCVCHLAGRKAFPDKLIETELLPGQGILDRRRSPGQVRGTDGLMGILNLFAAGFRVVSGRHIRFSIIGRDIIAGCLCRLLGHSGGIGTQIGNQGYGTAALDIHAFIKLLRHAHGLLGGEIQRLGSLLLQGTGGKRKRRLLYALPDLYLADLIGNSVQFFQDLIHLLFGADCHFSFLRSIEMRLQRFFSAICQKIRVQRPVFLRYKRVNLLFPIRNQPERYRLNTACA